MPRSEAELARACKRTMPPPSHPPNRRGCVVGPFCAAEGAPETSRTPEKGSGGASSLRAASCPAELQVTGRAPTMCLPLCLPVRLTRRLTQSLKRARICLSVFIAREPRLRGEARQLAERGACWRGPDGACRRDSRRRGCRTSFGCSPLRPVELSLEAQLSLHLQRPAWTTMLCGGGSLSCLGLLRRSPAWRTAGAASERGKC